MVCAAAGRKLRNMLRVEGKYLPEPEGRDDAMTEETGELAPESRDKPRRSEAEAMPEAAYEARVEAAFDPACEATFDPTLDPRVGRVLSAIEGNPFVTIRDLCRLVSLSQSRLSHLFKAAQGVKLKSFLSNRRMERVAQLLRSTEMQIKEMAYDAGYKQVPSFVRAFHKRFGASPTRYRRSG
jgi:AraC-like DNA-binding protein